MADLTTHMSSSIEDLPATSSQTSSAIELLPYEIVEQIMIETDIRALWNTLRLLNMIFKQVVEGFFERKILPSVRLQLIMHRGESFVYEYDSHDLSINLVTFNKRFISNLWSQYRDRPSEDSPIDSRMWKWYMEAPQWDIREICVRQTGYEQYKFLTELLSKDMKSGLVTVKLRPLLDFILGSLYKPTRCQYTPQYQRTLLPSFRYPTPDCHMQGFRHNHSICVCPKITNFFAYNGPPSPGVKELFGMFDEIDIDD